MRINANAREIPVAPGENAVVTVTVVNNDQVIDGVSARVIGMPDELVKVQPALLPLFPDQVGNLTLTIVVPPDLEAGRHAMTVEVVSHGAHAPTQYVDVDLLIAPRPAVALEARPRVARGRRTAGLVLEVANPGNVRLLADIRATDGDRSLEYRFSHDSLVLEPGSRTPVVMSVRGPRMITGSEFDRNVEVALTAQRLDLPPEAADAPADADADAIADKAVVQFRQRPVIARGLMTAFILVGIVALWAGAFLLCIAKVFASEPLTKAAPGSFFSLTNLSRNGAVSAGYDAATGGPLGALPKTGQLPPGVGSQISGSVIAASDQQPVGRILVEAVRVSHGKPETVSSAGSQADGTYTLAGLFPTSYYLKFSAEGFRTVWYPAAPSMSAGTQVATDAQGSVSVKAVTISGNAASISGSIDPGDTLTPVVATVTARTLVGGTTTRPAATTHTNASGRYSLRNLPAPGSYEVTFTAKGYEASAIVDTVTGGEQRLEPAVLLSAGQGQISGFVRDAQGPVGGATVSTIVNGTTVTVVTPTSGRVGYYTLEHLPTPATYVINFSAPGHGAVARIVGLGAGAQAIKTNFDTKLVDGTGSVTGTVTDSHGHGLGNVTITVGGVSSATSVAAPVTKSLSGGAVGSFAVSGLTAPGSYTLTAQLDGYRAETVPFSLTGNKTAPRIRIQLSQGGGSVRGRISGNCPQSYCAGATVTATDGLHVFTTIASAPSSDLPSGGYLFTGLPAGSYSVTVTLTGMRQQTAMVTVVDEKSVTQSLKLGGG